jgi:tRNA modification GTPase
MIDTIFAQATGPGRSGIAVIRISGPLALDAAAALAGVRAPDRTATLCWLRDPGTGERLDQALVLTFAGPRSFTGENLAELHLHGSPAVIRSVLDALGTMPGLRAAEPGEFTRRALMNGRLDLPQVEGLADLLAAETAAQQRQAVAVIGGALTRLAAEWRGALTGALAFVEATIDFADEELPDDVLAAVGTTLATVGDAMRRELQGSRIAERLRDGFEVALVGRPNVGKSTLLNAIAGREAALTSEVAGTTRDVIELRLDLDGLPLTLLDMAGLRAAGGRVEGLGVARARERAAAADLRIFLVDDRGEIGSLGVGFEPGDVAVLAKADLRTGAEGDAVSGRTGAGIDALLARVADVLQQRAAAATTASHARQRSAIEQAASAVARARGEMARAAPRVELAAEEIRAALRALDFLTGRVDVEAVLDVVFRSFCLGK